MATATSVPRTIVSGSPIPSSRSGTPYSLRSARSLIREASANNTIANVISANVRTVALVGLTATSSMTSGPTSSPISTNAIAGVNAVSVSRHDTPATASSAAAMIASSHFTDPRIGPPERPRIARIR